MSEEVSRSYRALWISDVHLGTRGAKAELLLDFLRRHEAEQIYLVGDVIDFWKMKRSVYWPPSHGLVVREFLDRARAGTRVIFIPGNHDEALREYVGLHHGTLSIERTAIHEAKDGRRFLVLHGDEFDVVVRNIRWLSHLGDWAYAFLLVVNVWFNAVRRRLGYPYWSLSAYLKLKVKNAVNFIGRFEEVVAESARRKKLDGVICGHIHHAEIKSFGRITYMNDGDWVESCTALAEDHAGRFHILRWAEENRHEDPDRDRRVAPAGERRDAYAGANA